MIIRALRFLLFVLCAVTMTAPATAGDRNFSVSNFDRIRVIGPYVVDLETGKPPSAKAIGSPQSQDRVSITQVGEMLIIRTNSAAWSGVQGKKYGTARLKITVPMLKSASVEGNGILNITAIKGQRVQLGITGSGMLSVAKVQADLLDVSLAGDGTAALSGTAQKAIIYGRGNASLKGALLKAKSVELTWQSAGNAEIEAVTLAKINSTGSGNVTVTGARVACTVDAAGAGDVMCNGASGSTSN
jgi:Putative auto-transporter adhesin, head GIN domain